jgi:hypothetical protein
MAGFGCPPRLSTETELAGCCGPDVIAFPITPKSSLGKSVSIENNGVYGGESRSKGFGNVRHFKTRRLMNGVKME